MTFEEWWKIPESVGDCFEDVAKAAWDAATEEVKKDHFKIGEEVEALGVDGGPAGYVEVCVIAKRADYTHLFTNDPQRVRRLPVLRPPCGKAPSLGVVCVKCGKRWIAVYPAGTLLKDLQCPKCKRQGYVILTGQEFDNQR